MESERGASNVVGVSANEIERAMARFHNRYKMERLKIKEVLGDENVTVDYGFIFYYS